MEQAAATARAVSHQFTFTTDFFFDTIANASWHMDQPMGHPNSVGIWLLAERAREFVTVLLSGEGADEVLGGYTRFYYANLQSRVGPWLPLLRLAPGFGGRVGRQFRGSPADSFIMASLFEQPGGLRGLRPDADFAPVLERRRALFAEGQSHHLDNCFRYEMQTYLVDLLVRQDKMTMAHSVENRVPFLDRKLVEFTRSIPYRHLVADSIGLREPRMRGTKVLLKQLAAKLFDERFAYRKKSGFSLPLTDLFAGSRAARLMEDRILPRMRDRGLTDAEVVRGRWKRITQLDQGGAESVWISVALELWAQQFLDARDRRPAATPLPAQVSAPSAPPRPPFKRSLRAMGTRATCASCSAGPRSPATWRRAGGRSRSGPASTCTWCTRASCSSGRILSSSIRCSRVSQTASFRQTRRDIDDWLLQEVAARRPDVVVVCGWIFWPYTRLMAAPQAQGGERDPGYGLAVARHRRATLVALAAAEHRAAFRHGRDRG
jgi:hypothetical protein